ncbi:Hypothetical protein A7982_03015 [Minicystis rosea]|nr:Hypothetical protein A7982_03015 [Minicystis rosea]
MTKHLLASLFVACSIFVGCAAAGPTESDGEDSTTDVETPAAPDDALKSQLMAPEPEIPACNCTSDSDCTKGKKCVVYTWCGRCG